MKRITRKIKTRPITKSGIQKMQDWFIEQKWDNMVNGILDRF